MSRIQVFAGERAVPPQEGETVLRVEALVPEARPREGRLRFETAQVNFKNNRVRVNGRELGYLQGPGYGKESRDYQEAVPVPPGVLQPGLNRVDFEAGADVSGAGVGASLDRFVVRDLWLEYEAVPAAPGWLTPPVLGAAFALLLAALLMARAARDERAAR